jgi:putative ABC transport system permease protein
MSSSYLSLIPRNILRNRRRSAFTIASVAVSICLVGLLFALTRALFFGGDSTPGQAKRVVVHHKIALTQDLPVGYEQTIEKIPGVTAVTSLRWFGGTYKDARDPNNRFAQFAIEPKTLFDVHAEYQISQPEKKQFVARKAACVASRALAKKLGWKPGERITIVGGMLPATLELTLAGIFDAPREDTSSEIFFNRDYLRTVCLRATLAETWSSSSMLKLLAKAMSPKSPNALMPLLGNPIIRRKANQNRPSC